MDVVAKALESCGVWQIRAMELGPGRIKNKATLPHYKVLPEISKWSFREMTSPFRRSKAFGMEKLNQNQKRERACQKVVETMQFHTEVRRSFSTG